MFSSIETWDLETFYGNQFCEKNGFTNITRLEPGSCSIVIGG